MIGLAFRLAWASARLLLLLSWTVGTLCGYGLVAMFRWFCARASRDGAEISSGRGRTS